MKLKSGSRTTAIILGAGATRGAIGHVVLKQKRLKPPLNSDFFRVAETYARAKGPTTQKRVRGLLHVFKKELPLGREPSLEEAFSLLYIAKDFPSIYKSGPGPNRKPGSSSEVDDFLAVLFGVLSEVDRQATGETGYDRLVRTLERADSILTLNYDTCLDSSLVRSGWSPGAGYALPGGNGKCRWRPNEPEAQNVQGVKLLKLHGSMNWWVRSSQGTLGDVFSKKPAIITAPRVNNQTGYIRQIIPPIYGKHFAHSHWQVLWKKAYDALCSADRLVVVGCSIIETDFHLQGFLRRVVQERKRSTHFREVILVDRSSVRRRWQRVLRGAVTAYREFAHFEEFLKKGCHV